MTTDILSHISLFVFVFTILVLVRLAFNFISSFATFRKMNIETRELIFYSICLSYFITYIISV